MNSIQISITRIVFIILATVTGISCSNSFPDDNYGSYLFFSILNPWSSRGTNGTPGVTISGQTFIMTSEALTVQQFGVALNTQPTATVSFDITSSDPGEGLVSLDGTTYAGSVTVSFDGQTWDTPQTIFVQGQSDGIADGNIQYKLTLSAITSKDADYGGLVPPGVPAINLDVDSGAAGIVGIVIYPTADLVTTEGGGTAQFAVVLQSQPAADVTIPVVSTLPAEATVSTANLTFTSLNWNTVQTVTVTGVDDFVADGNQPYSITLGATSSTDTNYNAVGPYSITAQNSDDDVQGITVSTNAITTSETGTTGSFDVTLNTQPTADVTVTITAADPSEGNVSCDSGATFASTCDLVFTNISWSSPQPVVVLGVDDTNADGSQNYTVTVDPFGADYGTVVTESVSVTNTDDETAGITVNGGPFSTSESGTSGTFSVVLNSDPTANVTVGVYSNDTSEAVVSSSSLTFTSGTCPGTGNWCTAQIVTVSGVDDLIADGNQSYSIITQPASSTDPVYNGKDPADLSGTNSDDDSRGITLFDPTPAGIHISEAGQMDGFSISLNTQPDATVTFPVSVPVGQEISVDGGTTWATSANLVFTPANWFQSHAVFVRSVDDTTVDHTPGGGVPTFTVTIAAGTGSDTTGYVGLDPADFSGENKDNELYLYVTAGTHNGGFDIDSALTKNHLGVTTATNNNLNGIEEADNFCLQDTNFPGGGDYRAMLVDNFSRRASWAPDAGDSQIDWVLQPNTSYYRMSDNRLVMTTNGNGIFVFGTLTNPFIVAATDGWTGLLPNWVTASGYTCNVWTDDGSGASTAKGAYASMETMNSAAISTGFALGCSNTFALLCVEQQ